jgi:inorganic pyrophosphatase
VIIEHIPALKGSNINVIVETPLGSATKYAYDPETGCMRVKHHLPSGYFFSFNFGFIPSTQAEDGDPLDVVLYNKESLVSGALAECRVLGALLAQQKEKKVTIRNDRIIGVPSAMKIYDSIQSIRDIDREELDQLREFFVSYEKHRHIDFKPMKWVTPTDALKIINHPSKRCILLTEAS